MSQNKYQPLVEDADNDSRKSEDLDHAHKVSLVESLVEDGSSKPLGTIQAVLRQCAKRPNAKALLTQWSVAGLFMALFRMLCREDFLGIADLEEVYAVVALMLTNPDLHREFVDTWIRCTVQHGVRDAMLFIMCRSRCRGARPLQGSGSLGIALFLPPLARAMPCQSNSGCCFHHFWNRGIWRFFFLVVHEDQVIFCDLMVLTGMVF